MNYNHFNRFHEIISLGDYAPNHKVYKPIIIYQVISLKKKKFFFVCGANRALEKVPKNQRPEKCLSKTLKTCKQKDAVDLQGIIKSVI